MLTPLQKHALREDAANRPSDFWRRYEKFYIWYDNTFPGLLFIWFVVWVFPFLWILGWGLLGNQTGQEWLKWVALFGIVIFLGQAMLLSHMKDKLRRMKYPPRRKRTPVYGNFRRRRTRQQTTW